MVGSSQPASIRPKPNAAADRVVIATLPRPPLQGPFAQLDFIGFEEVARLDVGMACESNTAFQTGPNLGHVILEAPERRDLAIVDDDVVARDASLERLADKALGNEQAG